MLAKQTQHLLDRHPTDLEGVEEEALVAAATEEALQEATSRGCLDIEE